MRIERTKEEWMELRDRYYEAQTTPREERELAEFLFEDEIAQTSEWDADRAVLSVALMGRKKTVDKQKRSNRRMWQAAAAMIGVALASYSIANHIADRDCWIDRDGDIYYSEQMASEQMEENLLCALADYSTVEDNLLLIFTED